MSDKKPEKKFPHVTVGVFITNKKGEVFLMRSPKMKEMWCPPGGHVDYGETVENTVEREVMEETGLKIKNSELLKLNNAVELPYYNIKKHMVFLEYKAELDGENQKVILDEREGSEYKWFKPEDVLKLEDAEPFGQEVIREFFVKKKKNKKCKNCEKQEKESEEYKIGWQRALADYKNLQTEIEKRKGEWIKMSEAQIVEEFLPVYENLKTVLKAPEVKESSDAWVEGVKYTAKQFAEILKSHGILEIETVGEKFDVNLHEAVGEEDGEEDVIVKEVSGGYKMGDKVLKHAKVIVGKQK